MTVAPVSAVTPAPFAEPMPVPAQGRAGAFADMLLNGVDHVDRNLAHADALARAFVLDDSVPVHQVTLALEQARLSFDLMLQVRSRLVDAYQELSRMQL